jgi:hypothetical protein
MNLSFQNNRVNSIEKFRLLEFVFFSVDWLKLRISLIKCIEYNNSTKNVFGLDIGTESLVSP